MNELRKKIQTYLMIVTDKRSFLWLALISISLLYILPENFKLYTLITFVVLAFFIALTKDLFLSLFSLFFLTSFFLSPGKYYSFVVARAGEVGAEPFLSNGVVDSYGLVASDIFAFALSLWLLRNVFNFTFRRNYNVYTVISWFIFGLWGLYVSLKFSYYPSFSVVQLFHYLKIIVFFVSTLVLFKRKQAYYLVQLVSAVILFQVILGIKQLALGFSNEITQTSYSTFASTEDNRTLPRAMGTFFHANQYGLFLWLWFLQLMIYVGRQGKTHLTTLVAFGCLVGIIFSQSRTVWLLVVICSFLIGWKKMLTIVSQLSSVLTFRHKFILLIGILIPISTLIYSRISATQHIVEGSLHIREQMINEGLILFLEAPFTGYGINTDVKMLLEKAPLGYIFYFPYSIHLAYLQLALEVGIIGVGLFFLPIVILFRSSFIYYFKHRNSLELVFVMMVPLSILLYYLFHPHEEALELPFLGFFLAWANYHFTQLKRQYEKK